MKLAALRTLDWISHHTIRESTPFPLWRWRICDALSREAYRRHREEVL